MATDDSLLITLAPAADGRVDCVVRLGRSFDLGPRRWRGSHPHDRAAIDREASALAAARDAVTRRAADADALRPHGEMLFDLLLPAPVKAAIRSRAGGPLLIDGPAGVPWPLVHDGRGFLGLRFDLGEARTGGPWPSAASSETGRMLILADPADDLPAARAEGEAMAAVLGAAPRPPAYDLRLGQQGRAEVLRALRRYRVVHFAGHVDPLEAGGGWRLGDGHLDRRSVEVLRGGPVPQLVVVNACRALDATADALLAAGVRHLVGTDVDLPDLQGADVARDLMRDLLSGRPVGAALRRARQRAADRGDPAWTAYRLVGDPRSRYAEPDPVHRAELRRTVALSVRRPMPDALDARVEADRGWRRAVEAAVAPMGGQLLPAAGQLVRVIFGVPTRREDDIRRAAEAALALAGAAPDATVALESGRLAIAGDDLLGGPLDTSEAHCWRSPPGVHLGPVAARALRGIAHTDGARLVAIDPRPRPAGPFIGRAEELDRIVRIAERVAGADGRGAALTLVGPAGIGKSRLLDAAAGRLSGRGPIARVGGDGGGPFGVVEQLVRSLCGIQHDDPPERARARIDQSLERRPADPDFLSIDDLLGDTEGGDEQARRRHGHALAAIIGLVDEGARAVDLVPAIRALVDAAGAERPLVLFVEDTQHAPAPALAVLDALLDDPPNALLVITSRPDGALARRPESAHHHRLELAPLPTPAARALVAALRPDTPEDALETLLARAEGNPLFIHELVRHRSDAPDLPETIEALMQARIDRIADDDLDVLRAAAVIGRTFWQAGVARLLGRSTAHAALERLAAERFVARDPRSALPGEVQWRFEHGLLHAAVDGGLPRRARMALHGRAALWLADELPPPVGPRAADIARHRELAGDRARAVDDWLTAADHAEATLAPEAAHRALDAAGRLLEALDAPPERRADVEARLGALDQLAGRLDRAAERLRSALDATPPGAERARRLARLGAVALARGRTDEARAAVDAAVEALAEVPDPPPDALAEVHYQAAWTDYHQGALDDARARLEALLERLPADAGQQKGTAWRLLGTIAQQRGDGEGARYWLGRALRVLDDDVERARVLHGLAVVAVQRGEYDEAAAHYARTVRIRARLGDRAGLARTYSNLGTLCGERGDFPRAERYLREAIRIRTRLGHGSLAISHANLVELYLRQGHADAARAELDRVTALLDAGKAPAWARSELWRMTADVRLASGELAAADDAAERAIAVARDMGDPIREASGCEVRARIAAARGVIGDAIALFEDAIDIYEEHEAAGALSRVLEQLADLVEGDDPQRAEALRAERALIADG